MKNLSRAEKAAICLTLLFLVFTAGYFIGKSTARTVITFSDVDTAGQTTSSGAAQSAMGAPQSVISDAEPLILPEPSGGSDGVININTATADELDDLPGIGPELAERIIDYREDNGPFLTPADILDVKGIGQSKFNAIRDRITTEG